jgi:hypothetical protein
MPEAPFALDPNWRVLHNPTISHSPPTTVDIAFLHPARGIALFDIAPTVTADAVYRLHRTLLVARLQTIYPGPLPITYRSIPLAELAQADELTDRAFEGQAAMNGDPAWVQLAERVLGTAGQRTRPKLSEPPPPPQPSRAMRRVLRAAAAVPVLTLLTTASPLSLRERNAPPAQEQPSIVTPAQHAPIAVQASPAAPPKPPPATQSTALVTPHAVPPPDATQILAMLDRGTELLKHHDIAGARLVFEQAASNGSVLGSIALAQTYDPAILRSLDPHGTATADPALASEWYAHARRLNGNETKVRFYN